jgi:Tfp pilus assembly protein PilF
MGQGGFFRGNSVHALSRSTSIFIFPHHCRSSQITRPWRCLLALLCLLPVLAAFLAAGEPQWLEVRSEHFSVVTDAGEKTGRHVACLFEQVRAAFGVLFARDSINEPVQLQIIAFRNASELRQYSPIFRGRVVEVSGFFQPGDDMNFILVDTSQENNWQVVFHEYAHLLLNGNFPPTAPWFDEGFAEYLSTTKISRNGTLQIGLPVPSAELLDEPGKFRLLDLFQVQHHSETYNQGGQARDMFYAESWLVAHYLFDSNQLFSAERYFVLTKRQNVPIPDAVQQAFGISLAKMEQAIWVNWGSGKLYGKTLKDKIPTSFTATVRPLNLLEARARLADFCLHSPDYGARAVQEFEGILRKSPNLEAAQRGLAYANLRRGDLVRADEHFRIAAMLGSDDPRVYYYSAALLQQLQPTQFGSAEFLQDLENAIRLDPQYAEAYHLLGLGMVRVKKYVEAERNIRRAIELSPRNEMFRLNLAVALVNQHKIAQGKAILEGLTNSSDQHVVQQAYQMMLAVSHDDLSDPQDPADQHDKIVQVPTN